MLVSEDYQDIQRTNLKSINEPSEQSDERTSRKDELKIESSTL